MTLQKLLSFVRQATDQYQMIEEGDKIAVGISGGKDSLALLIALKHMQRFYPKKFEVEAITVCLGFPNTDFSPVKNLCSDLDITYTIVKTDIGRVIFDERKEKNPCSLCSKMRKGALHDEAVKRNCNKIALGHNRDDVIETFFMSLFYEGRINTFTPVTYLDRKDIYSIRPLMYVPEQDIISFIKKNEITIVKSPCPVDGHTKREEIKNFVHENRKNYLSFDKKIFGAIQRSDLKGYKKEQDNIEGAKLS